MERRNKRLEKESKKEEQGREKEREREREGTFLVLTSPHPLQSNLSITFGLPPDVICNPGAPGLTPKSKMTMILLR